MITAGVEATKFGLNLTFHEKTMKITLNIKTKFKIPRTIVGNSKDFSRP